MTPPERKKPSDYWTTKDGKKLKISEMTTSHIKNCIRLLQRYESHLALEAYAMADFMHGEIAKESLESEGDRLCEEGDDEVQEKIAMFEIELGRRTGRQNRGEMR